MLECASNAPRRSRVFRIDPCSKRFAANCPSAFAACALGRTFTVSYACRAENRVMNNCMMVHATQDERDAAREEWFAMRLERQRAREEHQKVARAQEDFMKEWWGLPEDVRLSRQKEMQERVRQAERVGGMAAADRRHEGGEKR
jgi:COX assembly protein 1